MGSASSPPVYLFCCTSVAVDRKAGAEVVDLGPHLRLDLGVAVLAVLGDAVEHVGDQMADLAELRDAEASRRSRRRTQSHARRDGVLLRIARNAVLVDGDAGAIEHLLCRHTRRFLWSQVDQHDVAVGAAGYDLQSALGP